MSEKSAERMIEDDANSAAVDAWRHPIEAIPEEPVGGPQAKAEPKSEPAKEPAKR